MNGRGIDGPSLQVKICGLTRPGEAARCAEQGADAIGLVFYPQSPRHLTPHQARRVVQALPRRVAAVGVFVDADLSFILSRVDRCGLSMVQLHGRESPLLVEQLARRGIGVIKALFVDGRPGLDEAERFAARAFLVECARGPLPGGNAQAWNWGAAREMGRRYPLVLAGGLTPDNVGEAIQAARPAAIDLSSGVEAAPGRKDPLKVQRLLAAVRAVPAAGCHRSVFCPRGAVRSEAHGMSTPTMEEP